MGSRVGVAKGPERARLGDLHWILRQEGVVRRLRLLAWFFEDMCCDVCCIKYGDEWTYLRYGLL